MRRFIAPGVALAALLVSGFASAQQRAPVKLPTVSSLAAQGFEVKAVGQGEGLILQKDGEVYWCVMRLANTQPMSYQTSCHAIR